MELELPITFKHQFEDVSPIEMVAATVTRVTADFQIQVLVPQSRYSQDNVLHYGW